MNNLYTVWISVEASHTERVLCRCTNRLAACRIAAAFAATNRCVTISDPYIVY